MENFPESPTSPFAPLAFAVALLAAQSLTPALPFIANSASLASCVERPDRVGPAATTDSKTVGDVPDQFSQRFLRR